MTEIACPTCQKKYRLGDRFPAVFTCKSCGTAMDLSGFPGARAAAPAAPVAPAAPSAADEAAPERPSSRAGGRSGSRARAGAGGRAAARSRRGRGGDADGEEGEEGARFRPARRGMSPALLWGSLGGFVVVVALLILVLNKKKEPDKPETTASGKPAATAEGTTPAEGTPPAGAAPGAAPGTPAPAGTGTDPASGTPAAPGAPAAPEAPPSGKCYAFTSKVEIKPHDHHPDATPEERQKIDAWVQAAVFENLGSDSKAAERELVTLGPKAAPRVANVFHTLKTKGGYESPEGMSKAMIADRILRRIDGVIERKFSVKLTPIHARSEPKHAEKIMKIWSWWVDTHGWTKPQKPWDEREEGKREDAEEAADSEAAMSGGMSP